MMENRFETQPSDRAMDVVIVILTNGVAFRREALYPAESQDFLGTMKVVVAEMALMAALGISFVKQSGLRGFPSCAMHANAV